MTHNSLNDILTEISIFKTNRRAVFLDEGFCELIKWRGISTEVNSGLLAIFPLILTSHTADLVKCISCDQVVFLISSSLKRAFADILRDVRICCEGGANIDILVLTTTTEQAMTAPDDSHQEGYDELLQLLSPLKLKDVSICYFPLHSYPITRYSSSMQESGVDAFVLSNLESRMFSPLTLSSIGLWNVPEKNGKGLMHQRKYIDGIDVEHIPSSMRSAMRCLAHELAGAICFMYNLDCTSHVFALGKTSDFIGHTMQPIMERLLLERANALKDAGRTRGFDGDLNLTALQTALQLSQGAPGVLRELHGQTLTPNGDSRSPQKGALLLLDRNFDMFTPGMQSVCAPLAHKLINVLPRSQGLSALARNHSHEGLHEYPACDMAGMSSSDFTDEITPSLLFTTNPASAGHLAGEVAGCEELCKALRKLAAELKLRVPFLGSSFQDLSELLDCIMRHGRTLPVAEWAVLQTAHSELLAFATATSAAFKTVQNATDASGTLFQVPFNTRTAREQALLQLLSIQGTGVAEAIPLILSFLTPSKAVRADPCAGPSCIMHTLLLLLLAVSLAGNTDDMEHAEISLAQSLSIAATAIVERMLTLQGDAHGGAIQSVQELETLVRYGILPARKTSRSDIAEAVDKLVARLHEHALDQGLHAADAGHGVHAEEPWAKYRGIFSHVARQHLRAYTQSSPRDISGCDVIGLLARLVGSVLDAACDVDGLGSVRHQNDLTRKAKFPLDFVMHVESPMAKIKRAGLGLLSKGFSLWGGSNDVLQGEGRAINTNGLPHLADFDVLVVFIIGGVSYRELGQVREQLEVYYGNGDDAYKKSRIKIIIGSTYTLTSADLLQRFIM